ncbi:MAG: hypothetical protein AAF802_02955 [Planctomycetota bacterium]
MRDDLATIRHRLSRLPESSHSDDLHAKRQLESLEAALQPSQGSLLMTSKQVSDYLCAIQTKYRETVTLPDSRDIMKSGERTDEDVDKIMRREQTVQSRICRNILRNFCEIFLAQSNLAPRMLNRPAVLPSNPQLARKIQCPFASFTC